MQDHLARWQDRTVTDLSCLDETRRLKYVSSRSRLVSSRDLARWACLAAALLDDSIGRSLSAAEREAVKRFIHTESSTMNSHGEGFRQRCKRVLGAQEKMVFIETMEGN